MKKNEYIKPTALIVRLDYCAPITASIIGGGDDDEDGVAQSNRFRDLFDDEDDE